MDYYAQIKSIYLVLKKMKKKNTALVRTIPKSNSKTVKSDRKWIPLES
jgi:hypothetical protein